MASNEPGSGGARQLEPYTRPMGATGNIADPKSGSPPSKPRDLDEQAAATGAVEAMEPSPSSVSTRAPEAQPVRRSSLRPAPPSFRPSTRDPGQVRPAMVVHAGDAEETGPTWEIPEPAPSRPSQVRLDNPARIEPFPLAPDVSLVDGSGETQPLVIPLAPGIPDRTLEPTVSPDQPGAAAAPSASPPTSKSRSGVAPHRPPAARPDADPVRRHSAPSPAQASSPPTQRPPARVWWVVATAVVLVGGVVATMTRAAPSDVSNITHNPPPSIDQVGAPANDTADDRPIHDAPQAAKSAEHASTPKHSDEELSGEAKRDHEVQAPNTVRVTLEVKPADAKVVYHGSRYPGPPFEFDVPKGKRIAVEVSRFGFATRRVDLDDKHAVVQVGLLRAANQKKPAR